VTPEPAAKPSDRGPRAVAWILWVVANGLVLAGIGWWLRSGYAPLAQQFMAPLTFLALIGMVVAQSSGGLILAVRRPDLNIGYLILGFAVAAAPAVAVNGYIAEARVHGGPLDPAVAAWIAATLTFPIATCFAFALGLVFPTGRLLSPRWRIVIALAVAATAAEIIAIGFTPGPLFLVPAFDNPFVAGSPIRVMLALRDVVGPALLSIGAVLTGLALVLRYRFAGQVERLQIRWYLASGVLLVLGFIGFVTARVALVDNQPAGQLLTTLFYAAAAVPPLAIVFAILRYRLYGIDTILGRAFVYGALTAILAGMYAASIRLFNALFVGLTNEHSEVALVVTTLVLATSFTPVKRRLEGFADRYIRPTAELSPGEALLQDAQFVQAIEAIVRRVLVELPASRRPGK
jgi:hypothetical protein